MDLSQLLAVFCGPYGPIAGAALVIGYGLLRRRFPNLPALPLAGPAPGGAPSLPVPTPGPAGNFPILRELLRRAGLPVPADLAKSLPADQVAALWSEVDSLADDAAKHREGEAAALK